MRFENTRAAQPSSFAHRAAYYSSAEELVSVAAPIAEAGLRGGTPVALIASSDTERRLREALVEPVGLIHLPPPKPWMRRSGQTLATRRAHELRDLVDWAGPVTVIAEHRADDPDEDPSSWVETDVALNLALSSAPITMTCLYPASLAEGPKHRAVLWSHPWLIDPDGTIRRNSEVRQPAEVLAAHPVPAASRLGTPDHEMTFTPWQLIELRTSVGRATDKLGMEKAKADDFIIAVNEVASNAVEHGRGLGTLQIWQRHDRLVCEVHDTGALAEPLPGLRLPHPSASRGRGVWMARQLCDLLHVWSDGKGTHVQLQAVLSGSG